MSVVYCFLSMVQILICLCYLSGWENCIPDDHRGTYERLHWSDRWHRTFWEWVTDWCIHFSSLIETQNDWLNYFGNRAVILLSLDMFKSVNKDGLDLDLQSQNMTFVIDEQYQLNMANTGDCRCGTLYEPERLCSHLALGLHCTELALNK